MNSCLPLILHFIFWSIFDNLKVTRLWLEYNLKILRVPRDICSQEPQLSWKGQWLTGLSKHNECKIQVFHKPKKKRNSKKEKKNTNFYKSRNPWAFQIRRTDRQSSFKYPIWKSKLTVFPTLQHFILPKYLCPAKV